MDVNRTIAKSIVNIEILLSKVGLGFMDGVIDTVAISSEVLRPEVVQVLAGLTRRVYRPLRGSRSLFSGFYIRSLPGCRPAPWGPLRTLRAGAGAV